MLGSWNFSFAIGKNLFFLKLVWKFPSRSLKMFVYMGQVGGSVG